MGQAGYDDGQGDPLALYGKKDCRLDMMQELMNRPLADALPTTNLTESRTRTSAGIYNRLYTMGGAVDSFIHLRVPEVTRTGTSTGGVPQSTYALHGYKVTSIDLNYVIATLAPTSITVTAVAETAQANNVARSNATVTALGAVTYQNPVGTVVSVLPVATQAAPYCTRVIFATPVFVPANHLAFEIELIGTNTAVVSITGLWFNYTLAVY